MPLRGSANRSSQSDKAYAALQVESLECRVVFTAQPGLEVDLDDAPPVGPPEEADLPLQIFSAPQPDSLGSDSGSSDQDSPAASSDLTGTATNGQGVVSGELMQWHRTTITFDGPDVGENSSVNPFLQYRLNVTFTGPSGQQFVVAGFYAADGDAGNTQATSGNKWRVHFMPDEVGQWTYQASFRTGSNIAVSLDANAGVAEPTIDGASGTFTIAASDKTGRDFRAPEHGLIANRGDFYLTYASGDVFIKGGPNIPENLLGYEGFDNTPNAGHDFDQHVQDWKPGDPDWDNDDSNTVANDGRGVIGALNYISSQGGNTVYFLPMNIGGDGRDTFPTIDPQEKTRYDVSKLDQWEMAFEHATENGIFLHFVLAETESNNENYHDNGNLGTQRKLFYRELLARFGHHPGLQLNIGEENDYGSTKHRQFAAHLKALDPYDHPVTTHTKSGQYDNFYNPLLGNGDFDITSFQGGNSRTSMANLITTWRDRSDQAGQRWAISFDEPQKIENDKNDASNGYIHGRRDKMWPVFMSGGAGFEWYVQQDGGGHSFDQQIDNFRDMDVALQWTGHAIDFLEKLPLLDMAPDHSLGGSASGANTYVLAKTGETYALYNDRNGSGLTLDLSGVSGTFEVQWFNPRSGGNLLDGTVTTVQGGGVVSIGSAPNTTGQDWAAIVSRVGPGTPTPTITLTAPDASASETGDSGQADPGQFVITRSGETDSPLTVNYSISGTASNNDYTQSLTGSVTFAQGVSSVTLDITPVADDLSEGPETLQLRLQAGTGYNLGSPSTATLTIADSPVEQAPFGGSPQSISNGSRIQAEDFDLGGEGVAYSDSSSANQGGQYRANQGVDIESTSDAGGGYNIGWTENGEWLEYSVQVTEGLYDLHARVAASPSDPGDLRVLISDGPDGEAFRELGVFSVESTGGWQNFTTVTLPQVSLAGGEKILRLEVIGGNFNINYLEFEEASQSQGQKILFIRGADGTGGFLEGGSDEQLADITNDLTTGGNHGWGQLADVLEAEGYLLEQIIEGSSPTGQGTPGAFLPNSNGNFVFEAEWAVDPGPGGFEFRTTADLSAGHEAPSGGGYVEATGAHLGNTNGETLTYQFTPQEDGFVRINLIASHQGNTTEENDTWTKIELDGVAIPALDQNVPLVSKNGFYKTYSSGGKGNQFILANKNVDHNGQPIVVPVEAGKTYDLLLSERSAEHEIDKIALEFFSSEPQGFGNLTTLKNEPLSQRASSGTPGLVDSPVPLSTLDLDQYAVIVFGSNNAVYTQTDVDAFGEYIQGGGAALFISDANFGSDWADAANSDQQFLDLFGIEVHQDQGTYVVGNEPGEILVPAHPIFDGVSQFDGEGVSPFHVTNSVAGVEVTLLAGAEGNTRLNQPPLGSDNQGPSRPTNSGDASVLIATSGQGRIAGHYDRNTFFNSGGAGTDINRFDNRTYAVNLFNWLANGDPVSEDPVNTAPSVDAGADQQVQLPNGKVALDATVSDDGYPIPSKGLTARWSLVSGPGEVSFADAQAVDTTATFSTAGTYTLRLTVDDGELTASDDLIITVSEPSSTLTATLVDDAYLENGQPFNNDWLKLENASRVRTSFLKFDIRGLNGQQVQSAKLNLTVDSDPGNGTITASLGEGNWTETTLTSNNAPVPTTLLDTVSGSFGQGQVISLDVTSAISGDGFINLVLGYNAGGNDVWFSSSEGPAAPELIIETVDSVIAPPTAVSDTFVVAEDSKVTSFSVLANDNTGGQPVSLQSVGPTSQGGTVNIVDQRIEYQPAAGFSGTETFSYKIQNSAGQSTATVTVQVTPVTDLPSAVGDTFEVNEDSSTVSFDVLSNDASGGGTLTLIGVGTTSDGGIVNIVGDRIEYQPAADFFGTETFSYTVENSAGQSSATVTVNVAAVNDLPTAVADSFVVEAQSQGNLFAVLENDSIAPDAGEVLTIIGVSSGSEGGTIVQDGKQIRYSPRAGFSGTERFSYSINDGTDGSTSTATVEVTVEDNLGGVLNFKDFSIDSYGGKNDVSGTTAIEDGGASLRLKGNNWKKIDLSYTVTANTVLEFDFQSSSEGEIHGIGFDNDTKHQANRTFQLFGTQNWGLSEFANYNSASGAQRYVISVGEFYTGTFSNFFIINDDDANANAETVLSNVRLYESDGGPLAPTAVADTFTVPQDADVRSLDVLGNDDDGRGTIEIVSVSATSAGGTVNVNGQNLEYQPKAGFAGVETFSYTIENSAGQSTTSVTITIPADLGDRLNFHDFDIGSYGGKNDASGTVAIEDGGASLRLTGNNWKKIDFSYTVTANTVLEFDFQSSSEGEIHGIGFDNDTKHQSNRTFQLFGTQNWGLSEFANYTTNSGDQRYVIPVGEFYTGQFKNLFIVNDDDANSNAETIISNLRVYEATDESFEVVRVASGLSQPLFATAAPGDNNRLFIAEKGGQIKILDQSTGQLNTSPFLDVSDQVSTNSERGLVGFVFHPDYQSNGRFFVSLTNLSGDTEIREYQVSTDPDLADSSSFRPILSFAQPEANHNGGWLGFGPDGYLYISSGDGGGGNDPGNNAQDITDNLLGKILRIDIERDDFPGDATRNYAVPSDNPFVGTVGDDEIWVYGLRNPWRPSFDRETGDLYIADVGQGAREEINVQPASSNGGENYGWRVREGTIATPNVGGPKPLGAIDPIYDYAHGNGPFQGNSVTGGYAYRGPIQQLQGQYFFGDFVSGGIWSLQFDGSASSTHNGTNFTNLVDRTSQFTPDAGAINTLASFGEDNQGNLYLVDIDGEVFQLRRVTSTLSQDAARASTSQADQSQGYANTVDRLFSNYG